MGRGRPGLAPWDRHRQHRAESTEKGGSRGGCRHSVSIRGAGSPWGWKSMGQQPSSTRGAAVPPLPPLKTPSGDMELQGANGGWAGVDAAVIRGTWGEGGGHGIVSSSCEQSPAIGSIHPRPRSQPPPQHKASLLPTSIYISSTPCAKIITNPGSSTMSSPMCWFSQAITTTACLPGIRLAT